MPKSINCDIKLQPKQRFAFDKIEYGQKQFLFYGGSKAGGKATSLDSILFTPHGEKKMGDIKINDIVACPDGTYSPVIAVYPQGKQPLFRVTFSDNASVLTTKEHLWYVRLIARKNKRNQKWSIYTTEELIDRLKKNQQSNATVKPNIIIPLTKPVQFTPVTNRYSERYKIDPYVLGVLIGDGCLRGTPVSFTTADGEIVESIGKYYPVSKRKGKYAYGIPDGGKLCDDLTYYGLYKHRAENKFIPEYYKISDVSVRFALIQGLFDTDGYIDDKSRIEYTTVSHQLALDVQWIIRSLGGKATITEKVGKYKNLSGDGYVECKKVYRLYITISEPAEYFQLERKAERGYNKKHEVCRRIESMEYGKDDFAQCIVLRHPAGLYLTNDFIVTHNSMLVRAAQVARRLKYANTKGVIIRKTYPEILKNHIREILSEYPFLRQYYRASERSIMYPNGSITDFQHLQYQDDVYDFQGLDYTDISLDEATQHDEETFKILKTSNRLSPGVARQYPNLKPKFLLTGNPGGIGMSWVKRLFIDKNFNLNERPDDYDFVQANIYDNPIFLNANPDYLQNLKDLPTDLMRAYLEGDWTVFVGQYFTDFRLDVHSVEPFHIDENWGKIFAVDWGYFPHPFAVGWYTVDFNGNIYKYRELLGHETSPQDLAQLIVDLSKEDKNLHIGVGDTQMWEINPFKRVPQETAYTDKSIADEVNSVLARGGMYMEQANKARVTGWTNLKTLMQWKGEINSDGARRMLKYPKYRIFSTCTETLKAYPNQIHSKLIPEDMQKQDGDDTLDTDRYALLHIIRGIKPVRRKTEVEKFIDSIVIEQDGSNREWDNY